LGGRSLSARNLFEHSPKLQLHAKPMDRIRSGSMALPSWGALPCVGRQPSGPIRCFPRVHRVLVTARRRDTSETPRKAPSRSRAGTGFDPWADLTPRQLQLLVASAVVVLEGATGLTFTRLAARLGVAHHRHFSVLHYKGYLVRGGRRGSGVTLTGRGWIAIAQTYGPWQDPSKSEARASGEAALLQGACNALRHLLTGGRARSKDHALLRALDRYVGDASY
jgi:hypothetical protein